MYKKSMMLFVIVLFLNLIFVNAAGEYLILNEYDYNLEPVTRVDVNRVVTQQDLAVDNICFSVKTDGISKDNFSGVLILNGKPITFNENVDFTGINIENQLVYTGSARIEYIDKYINLGITYSDDIDKALVTCVTIDKDGYVEERIYFGELFKEASEANKVLMSNSQNDVNLDTSPQNPTTRSTVYQEYYGIDHSIVDGNRVATVVGFVMPQTVSGNIQASVKAFSNKSGVYDYYVDNYVYDSNTTSVIQSASTNEVQSKITFTKAVLDNHIYDWSPSSGTSSISIPLISGSYPYVGFSTIQYASVSASRSSASGSSNRLNRITWTNDGLYLESKCDYYSTSTSNYITSSKGVGGTAFAQHFSSTPSSDHPGQVQVSGTFEYKVFINITNDDVDDFTITEYYTSYSYENGTYSYGS